MWHASSHPACMTSTLHACMCHVSSHAVCMWHERLYVFHMSYMYEVCHLTSCMHAVRPCMHVACHLTPWMHVTDPYIHVSCHLTPCMHAAFTCMWHISSHPAPCMYVTRPYMNVTYQLTPCMYVACPSYPSCMPHVHTYMWQCNM